MFRICLIWILGEFISQAKSVSQTLNFEFLTVYLRKQLQFNHAVYVLRYFDKRITIRRIHFIIWRIELELSLERLSRTRERIEVKIDFWCVSHQTFILFSKLKQHFYSHANYTFSAHIADIACFEITFSDFLFVSESLTWNIWDRCLASRFLTSIWVCELGVSSNCLRSKHRISIIQCVSNRFLSFLQHWNSLIQLHENHFSHNDSIQ